jgi:hypothetical protein
MGRHCYYFLPTVLLFDGTNRMPSIQPEVVAG